MPMPTRERIDIEHLDQATDSMLLRPQAPLPDLDAPLAPLLRPAAEMRELPKREFKERLRTDLQRSTSMPTQTARYIREGFHTVTPYLVVSDSPGLAEFVKQAFGAREL